jgi:succinoglycan biosynthesis transport protein ExoP
VKLVDYIRILRRRWRIVLAATIIVPLIAVPLSLRQDSRYSSSSDVLLSRQDVSNLVTGKANDPAATIGQGSQFTGTQSSLATVRPLLDRVVRVVGPPADVAQQFRDSASATPKRGTDLLTLSVKVGDRPLAIRLATTWAEEFIAYRHEIDTSALEASAESARSRLVALQRSGQENTAQYDNLAGSLQQLRSLIALESNNVTLVQPAHSAAQVAPRPKLAAILGILLGLALGIALALIRQATDRRVRTSDEIEEALEVPILGRLVRPRADGLSLLREHAGPEAEAHQLLGLSLRLANVHVKAKIILFTSAMQGEGKSTTTSNLAIALARTGHSVALVDLDLHRPTVGRLFNARGYGVTDVALGSMSLGEAMRRVDLHGRDRIGAPSGAANNGSLDILTTGPLPPSPAQFVAGEEVAAILRQLAQTHDYVLVDAPPMLGISDSVSLATDSVDAIVVVGRLGLLTRRALADLAELTARIEKPLLGFIVTGVAAHDVIEYTYEKRAPELDEIGAVPTISPGDSATPRSVGARP